MAPKVFGLIAVDDVIVFNVVIQRGAQADDATVLYKLKRWKK